MNTPSEQQKQIHDSLSLGHNVITNACAGSGKSTTVLTCADAFPSFRFLLLTFNKLLQTEMQEKIDEVCLTNLNVYTFHGLAVKYYYSGCFNDMGIRKVLRESMDPRQQLPECDVVVLDETQDMTYVFFEFMWKFCMDAKRPIQILILGDEKQGLYGFKGSDARFLTMGDFCWNKLPHLKSNIFATHTLNMSYRITDPMCKFLNEVMLGEERVRSCKPGAPVMYIRRNMYDRISGFPMILHIIKRLQKEENASYDDFFILAHSVKSKNRCVRHLENLLVNANIPVYVPNNDAKDELDSRVIQNKVVFSTFHSSKGRQRKYVIVLGFDDSHFMYNHEKNPKICPNELYVACTRGTHRLYVWEDIRKKSCALPFLKYNHNQLLKSSDFVSFQGIPSGRKPEILEKTQDEIFKRIVYPTELIRFISESSLDIISPIMENMFETLQPPNEVPIEIPTVHKTNSGSCEDVSDINGTVIPLMYFDQLRANKFPLLQKLVSQNMKGIPENEHAILWDAVKHMPPSCDSISDYLYMANLLATTTDLFYSRFKQIAPDDYQWITTDILQQCYASLNDVLREETDPDGWAIEQNIIHHSDEVSHVSIDHILQDTLQSSNSVYRFSARADLITDDSLWELKCTSQLTLDHKLQLIIYAWLHQLKNAGKKDVEHTKYFLYNIKTNEYLQLHANVEDMTTIVLEIIKNKYVTRRDLTDEEFCAQFEATHSQAISEVGDISSPSSICTFSSQQ